MFALMAVRCGSDDKQEPKNEPRNPKWAQPVVKPGLPNLHKISDDLYRGAQPEPQGFAELHKMGVKTVVNLRKLHSDEDEIEESGLPKGALNYVSIPLHAWSAEDRHIVEFLKVMADDKNHPVFVHCQHGADRTGTMSAIYRIAFQGWSKEEALKEMLDGGYGFHSIWVNLVDYLEKVDIERLKTEAGVKKK
jgi:protein tyrosine/serine phosphatase